MYNATTFNLSKKRYKITEHYRILIAVVLGYLTSFLNYEIVNALVHVTEQAFINLFKLVSLPIIFLSILSALARVQSVNEIKVLGKNVFSLTLLTTTIAALIALSLYLSIRPTLPNVANPILIENSRKPYVDYLLSAIPDNILQPFIEYNLVAVIFVAFIMGFATLSLPKEKKEFMRNLFTSFMDLFLKITEKIIKLIPLAIWAFVASLMKQANMSENLKLLLPYVLCIILANLIQAIIVLPMILRANGISSITTLKRISPVLWMAFMTKSSSAVLPLSIKYATEKLSLSPKIVNFALPLCTTINMNACASFILITILFASESHGVSFVGFDYIAILLFAVVAAIGNAGVPMGCYFMTTSFLVATNVPLTVMSMILPIYVFLDMLETAINVWSDICVTSVICKKHDELLTSQDRAA